MAGGFEKETFSHRKKWKNQTLEVLMVWDGLEFLGEAFFGVGEAKNLGKSRKE